MKHILIILSFFSFSFAVAQEETAGHKAAVLLLQEAYNGDKIDPLYLKFSEGFQKNLPPEKLKEFIGSLKSEYGALTTMEFLKINGNLAQYKTTFEDGVLLTKLAVTNDKIEGLMFTPYTPPDNTLPVIQRNTTALSLPFKDEWYVFWGGDTPEQNYHVESEAQKGAFDMVIMKDGKSYKTDGKKNEDYYAFGKELLAPCDAEVTDVVDGVRDNTPGELNPVYVPGNTVILKTPAGEYLFFAHFKQNSIKVKKGQKVKRGEVLGLCGNSGNSSEPHLHFHIQNTYDLQSATGAKCYFDKLVVSNESGTEVKSNYSPVKGDKIKPAK